MAYKNLKEFLIFIVLILFVNRVVNGQQFIPGPRIGSTSTLLGNKIYYIGGYRIGIDPTAGEFFYLDRANFTWVDLKSQGVTIPLTAWHASDIGGANIFIIGGRQLETTNLVYRFDTKTNTMTAPIIQGIPPPRREDMSSVSYGGKLYIFSGRVIENNKTTFFDRFDILDTVAMNWQVGNLANAPPSRHSYTATLVNGVIYYVGGMQFDQLNGIQVYVPMTDIYQYDIIGNTWTLKTAKALPERRIGHSAVLVNGKICIYGGTYFPAGSPSPIPSAEQIAMLDTTTLVWSIPSLQVPNIPSLSYHTATLIGKFMLIAFGNITNLPGGPVNNDKFYLFNFAEPNVKLNSFTAQEIGSAKALLSPTKSTSSTAKADNSSQSSLSKPVIIGLSVGLTAVSLTGIIGFTIIHKHMKKNAKVSADIPKYSPQFAPKYQYSNYSHGSHHPPKTPQSAFNIHRKNHHAYY